MRTLTICTFAAALLFSCSKDKDAKGQQKTSDETNTPALAESAQPAAATFDAAPAKKDEAAAATMTTDPAEFWTAFQAAAASGEASQIASFVDFPFQTRGMMDDDPLVEYDEAQFAVLVPGLLKADPGLNKESTMQAMIAATASVPADDLKQTSGKSFRVGDFVFDLGEQGWRFTMAFYDADQ